MKFENIEDLDIPIDAAFEMLSEFSFFDRMAMRRGLGSDCAMAREIR